MKLSHRLQLPQRSLTFSIAAWMILSSLFAFGCNGQPAGVSIVTQQEIVKRIDSGDAPRLLDVRSPGEFASGHVPGAINVPHDLLAEKFADLALAQDEELVVYCESGKRAGMAEKLLTDAGYTGVRHLEGDMKAWRAAALPTD